MNEKAFHAMSYGVYIVTSWDNGRPVGCTANCAAQITASPATVMVSVNKDNYTNKCIADCGHFALSILSENSSPEIIGRFGFQSSRDHDKFAETAYAVKNSLPVVSDSCAYICCKVVDTMDSPTHTVFLGEVIGADVTWASPLSEPMIQPCTMPATLAFQGIATAEIIIPAPSKAVITV